MSLILKPCVEFDDDRKVCVAEQKGKKYNLSNDSGYEIRKIRVDGCLFNKSDKRCDYLFIIAKIKTCFFIELKGGDLIRAVKQIIDSVIFLREELDGHTVKARIVGTRNVPNIRNTIHYRKLMKLTKTTGGSIEIKPIG